MKSPFLFTLFSIFLLCACHQDLVLVKGAMKYGYMTKKGDTVIPIKYFDAKPFKEGWARVGVSILQVDSFWREPIFEEKGYWQIDDYEAIKYTFINSKDSALPKFFDDAQNFSDGFAAVARKGKWGYINTEGKWVIKPQYAQAGPFHKGKASVTMEDKEKKMWYFLTINPSNEIVKNDEVGQRKPDRFDSILDWRTLMASGEVYIRLTDYSTAFEYYLATARRIDQIEDEDTLSYMDLCTNIAMLAAMRTNEPIYLKYDQLAREKFEEILVSNSDRRRAIILNYIEYLVELSNVRELNMEKDLEKETLERIIDAVKRSGTEDIKLYWDIEDRLSAFE